MARIAAIGTISANDAAKVIDATGAWRWSRLHRNQRPIPDFRWGRSIPRPRARSPGGVNHEIHRPLAASRLRPHCRGKVELACGTTWSPERAVAAFKETSFPGLPRQFSPATASKRPGHAGRPQPRLRLEWVMGMAGRPPTPDELADERPAGGTRCRCRRAPAFEGLFTAPGTYARAEEDDRGFLAAWSALQWAATSTPHRDEANKVLEAIEERKRFAIAEAVGSTSRSCTSSAGNRHIGAKPARATRHDRGSQGRAGSTSTCDPIPMPPGRNPSETDCRQWCSSGRRSGAMAGTGVSPRKQIPIFASARGTLPADGLTIGVACRRGICVADSDLAQPAAAMPDARSVRSRERARPGTQR